MSVIDLDLGLTGTHVLITGGAGYIGTDTVWGFLSAGAHVSVLDINFRGCLDLKDKAKDFEPRFPSGSRLCCYNADISNEAELIKVFEQASQEGGPIHCCVALASLDLSVLPHHASLVDMPLEQWKRTFDVNVHGTFLTARTWLRQLQCCPDKSMRNVSLIIVGSESGSFGERGNPDYASGKSAVQVGLLQSLKSDVPRIYPGARANAVAPGPVDTAQFRRECAANPEQLWLDAQATTALRTPVPTASVARSILFLASDAYSGHVHGQILSVDSGKQGKVMWTKEECS